MENFEWNANNFDQSEVKRCPEGENSNKETNKHKPTSADLVFQNQCNWRCNGVTFTLWQHSHGKAPRNLEIWNGLSNRFILLFSGWTFVIFSAEFCCSNFASKLHLGDGTSMDRQHTPFSEYPTGEVPRVCGLRPPQVDWNQEPEDFVIFPSSFVSGEPSF